MEIGYFIIMAILAIGFPLFVISRWANCNVAMSFSFLLIGVLACSILATEFVGNPGIDLNIDHFDVYSCIDTVRTQGKVDTYLYTNCTHNDVFTYTFLDKGDDDRTSLVLSSVFVLLGLVWTVAVIVRGIEFFRELATGKKEGMI